MRSHPAGRKPRGLARSDSRKPRGATRSTSLDVDELRERVVDLEARVRALAISRRVLITLLVSSDKKRKVEVAHLRGEVEKLRERNLRSSRSLAARDAVIHRLRCRLSDLGEDARAAAGEAEKPAPRRLRGPLELRLVPPEPPRAEAER